MRVVERRHAIGTPRFAGAVEVRSVSFGYADDVEVLNSVSLDIEPGERVALAGATGAGKSTLVSLIPRFYDTQRGAVLVDGVDVRDFMLASLRRQIALVLQDSILFHGSIRDNLAYGPSTPLTTTSSWRPRPRTSTNSYGSSRTRTTPSSLSAARRSPGDSASGSRSGEHSSAMPRS
jgi:ABC-type transport system involved in Fe-S cluster assembly fused permease/ATPase subunit